MAEGKHAVALHLSERELMHFMRLGSLHGAMHISRESARPEDRPRTLEDAIEQGAALPPPFKTSWHAGERARDMDQSIAPL